jgi:hypothetical protein
LAPAEREEWATKLANDYGTSIAALEAKKPTLKTAPVAGLGDRRTTLANATEVHDRAQKVQTLVQKEMKESGCDYATAFTKVQMANSALFEEMHDSRKQD